ncbi:glycoside hydrolase family 15 [Candidatus Wolfebacteria bacterium]|nr:MAG: glycoside hydrolase family 15 [Candidatus Wolfebacteria bacterium]
MSRTLMLGNGNILVGLDKRSQVRDFYFPHVGLENHIGGHFIHRVGIWVDGHLHWLDHPSWDIDISCAQDALTGETRAINTELGIELFFTDVVYNEKNIFIRQVKIKNTRSEKREIKIFFGHEFEIYESFRGDTAYFDPLNNTVVHYKGRRIFLINAYSNDTPFDEYSTGVFSSEGKEGTHRDAEDGILNKNPIEHGHADSVIGLTLILSPEEEHTIHYWICVGELMKEVHELNEYVLRKKATHLIKTTQDFWKAWVNRYNFNFYKLSKETVHLFKTSLFYIRAHADQGGAIIASGDAEIFQGGKDTYGYMWPRDASFAATALDRVGDRNVSKRFFEFCDHVITPDGYFMHKYRADESLGSSWHPWIQRGHITLPIQEDETAVVIHALWKHYSVSRDLEFIESIYNSVIEKAALFMIEYRDKKTGLPKPSYDLWEEKFGTHTFTASTVYAALIAAGQFASVLGKKESEQKFEIAAEEIKQGILRHLYDEETGTFYKMITIEEDGTIIPDNTIDMSSIYGVYNFGVLPPDDERVQRAVKETVKSLSSHIPIDGVARYEGDTYHGVKAGVPNPWFITTLWLAKYHIMMAKNEADLKPVKDILQWVTEHELSSGILSEQLNPDTGAQLSVAPLVWSHAEVVLTVIDYLEKLEELGICKACNPVK